MTAEQPYELLREYDGFELRRYPEHVLAEVTVDASYESAGTRAFRRLFTYISGANAASRTIAMTAPVLQAETDPVALMTEVSGDGPSAYRVAFVLPDGFTIDTAPAPTDPAVTLRAVPETVCVAARFRGNWSEDRYRRHVQQLRSDLAAAGIRVIEPPRSARFDGPFVPSFLRHNEVQFDVEGAP